MNNKQILITVVVALLVGGGAFFGGMQYQKSQPSQNPRGQFAQGQGRGGAGGGQRFGGGMGGAVVGEIISSDDKSITVKAMDGSSKIVFISDTTPINKAATAAKSDLKVGERVAVFGATGQDGTITAQNIQLNPMQRGPMGGNASPSPSAK